MTEIRHGRPRQPRLALGPERGEQVRTAAETMAVGVLFAAFSLPLVTAGAAWCAAAEVFAGWHAGREPRLLRTFARTVRRDLAAGLALECAVLVPLAAAWFEAHLVVRSRLPGFPVEATALVALGAAAAAFVLLTAGCRAAALARAQPLGRSATAPAASWSAAARSAGDLMRTAPSSLVLVVTAGAFCAVLVALIPAFAGFMAGPLAFAVSAVVARGARGRGRGEKGRR
jgi:hypothetical protein